MSGVGVRGLVGPVASATLLSLLIASSSGATVVTTSSVSETSVTTQGGLTSSIGCQRRRFDKVAAEAVLQLAVHRLARTARATPAGAYPSITDSSWVWRTTSAQGWTSGFFPGSLWLAYRETRRPVFKTWATQWTRGLAGQALDTSTHDVGFQIFNAFGNAYNLTHHASYRRTALRGATSLSSRYSGTVRAIRSWGSRSDTDHFKVIVDNLMNLELLFWATRHGGSETWARRATHHAATTATHFIRRNGSVRHLVDFKPSTGQVQAVSNPQGYRPWSTWSRGQAWAIRGFAAAYSYTHDTAFLKAARRTAAYYLRHVPANCVPYWDFNAPDIPDAPRDASAAAIAADGLQELAGTDPQPDRRREDRQAAGSILRTLADHYTAPTGQAVLDGSVSTYGVDPPDIGTSYGDYYYLHAIEARFNRG